VYIAEIYRAARKAATDGLEEVGSLPLRRACPCGVMIRSVQRFSTSSGNKAMSIELDDKQQDLCCHNPYYSGHNQLLLQKHFVYMMLKTY